MENNTLNSSYVRVYVDKAIQFRKTYVARIVSEQYWNFIDELLIHA